MAIRTTAKWLTVCLYYSEPWEAFLAKAVAPYLDVVMQTGVAERYFFQRSWERGPHIRICLKGNPYILENILKPNLQEHFLQYFESRPSLLVQPNYPAGFPENFKWLPNNSVQYVDYEPEPDRFGGRKERSLFERQFQASSDLVLKTIRQKANRWTHNEMVGTAIKLHLSFAYSIGMGMGEAAVFFKLLSRAWLLKNAKENAPSKHKNDFSPDLAAVRSFQKIFELQRTDIVPYHSALWELFKNYRKTDDQVFIDWFHVNSNLGLELGLAIESGKLKKRPNSLPDHQYDCPEQEQLWNLCEEFVHLTNNRLGIHHKNEGYLFYAMSQSLQAATAGYGALARVGA